MIFALKLNASGWLMIVDIDEDEYMGVFRWKN